MEEPTVRLLSRAEPGLAPEAGRGDRPSVSADGRYVAFLSAGTLVSGQVDSNGTEDVFLFDRLTAAMKLVSHAAGAPLRAAASPAATPCWRDPVISADGRFVIFCSAAPDLVAGFTGSGPQLYVYSRLDDSVTLVSHRAGAPSSGGNARSEPGAMSADGSYIAFQSEASDLVVGTDQPETPDVFLYERATGTVTLVSHALGAPTTAANGHLWMSEPSLSADGSRVAFASEGASQLVGGFGPYSVQAFLYDRADGQVRLVSHAGGPTLRGNNSSDFPVVSADGRFVVFSSWATNLVAGQTGEVRSNVFLYSAADGAITLVSHASGAPLQGGNLDSAALRAASISAVGETVAFESAATNLVAGFEPGGAFKNVFLWSRASGSVSLASRRSGSAVAAGNAESSRPSLGGDGSVVAFSSTASDLVPGVDTNGVADVFVFDSATGEVVLASHELGQPGHAAGAPADAPDEAAVVLAANGQLVAFASAAFGMVAEVDANGRPDVYLFDRALGSNTLASRRPQGPASASASGSSLLPDPYYANSSVSADGRYVAFESTAPDLVAGQVDADGESDVFLHDRLTGETRLLSHRPGMPSTTRGAWSDHPVISADGSHVAFEGRPTPDMSTECGSQIYLWSRVDDSVELLTRGSPYDCGNGHSMSAVISGDGSQVVFASSASNLVTVTSGFAGQLYRWSRSEGLRLVTHAPGLPGVGGDGDSTTGGFAISRDGDHVAFTSYATNLAGSPAPALRNIFLYSRLTDSIRLVSHAAASTAMPGNSHSLFPTISDAGEVVAFVSGSTDLTGAPGIQVYAYRRSTEVVTLVSHAAGSPVQGANGSSGYHDSWLPIYGPHVSGDGRHVAFDSDATDLVGGTDTNGAPDVFLHSFDDGTNRLVSHAPGAPAATAAGASWLGTRAAISSNGGMVLFNSEASDLAGGAGSGPPRQLFAYRALGGDVALVSRSLAGPATPANGLSAPAALSADGRWVAFGSLATDLVAGDLNSQSDVFLFGPTRPGADLSVGVAAQTAMTPPAALAATFVVVNLGPEAAENVSLSLEAPSALIMGATTGACVGWPCPLGTLLAGEFRTVTVHFTASSSYVAPDPVVIRVAASAGTPDPEPANDAGETAIAVLPRADLELSLSGPPSATPPHQLTYTLALTNRGPSDAVSVQLDDPAPPGLTSLASGGDCPTMFPCSLGPLAPGESRTATATFSLPAGYSGPDPIINVASASSATVDPSPTNSLATAHTLLDAASPPLGFFTIAPCRLVDTRLPDGPAGGPALSGGVERWFTAPGRCGIPPTARAIVLNVTVTGSGAPGNLRLWMAGKPMPVAAVVAYGAGQTRGANVIVGLNAFGALAVKASSSSHAIFDVTGYFE